jgi:ubiquinone/menaquinone biosynthesis C-methylase UbiE
MLQKEMEVVETEFNALAVEYENNRLSGWYKAHAEEMLNFCLDLDEGDILDVGCATGQFLRSYIKDKPRIRAIGIDISSTMIEVAKSKAMEAKLNNLEFIHADWEKLDPDSLKGYEFKAIFCANAFHYFKEPQTATDRLFKQLAENGTLYVLERNKARSLLTFIWGFLHAVLIKDQVVFYKTTELVGFLEKAGFKQVNILSSIKKYFWKNKLFTSIVLLEGKKDDQ